jgi:2-succinyl-5-enolpyruvyl-6-hydroxy-3-cyclohexene-1-carboxylate synthase
MLSTARLNADLAATLVAGALDAGVHDVVMSPGSRNTPLTLAFAEAANDEGRLRLHVFTDERTAGFVALGLARATGAPVALLCTSGSAAAHYLPAVIEASEDRVPLVILTADRPAELHGCGASQTVDQQRLFGVHVRHFRDLGSPATAPDLAPVALAVARALSFARGPLPGPVHLNVPFREPLWTPEVVGRPVRSPVALPRRRARPTRRRRRARPPRRRPAGRRAAVDRGRAARPGSGPDGGRCATPARCGGEIRVSRARRRHQPAPVRGRCRHDLRHHQR